MSENETPPSPPETPFEEEFDKRKELRIPLRVTRVEANLKKKAEVFFGHASNISKSGLFIQTVSPKEPGTKVKLKFTLPVTKELIICETEVMWTKNYAGSKSSPGMGLKFINITEEALAMIETFITANQS